MECTIYNMIECKDTMRKDLDFFIFSSGSDNRSYEILSNYKSSETTSFIAINYEERLADLNQNDTIFDYKKFGIKILHEITCSIKDPSSCLTSLSIHDFSSISSIGLDISVMTKPYFFFIIKLLKERFKVSQLHVFYTEPKTYEFPNGLYSKFRTCTGPLSIIEMPGYAGFEERGSKRKLIVLLGFDGDVTKEIYEDVAALDTELVNGFPSYIPKFKDISLIMNEKIVCNNNSHVKYAKANNPFDIYNLLLKIKNNSNNSFINIAPLGTKPMALGACLFSLHYPEVRIIYPLPEKYENKYSQSSWISWMYTFDL